MRVRKRSFKYVLIRPCCRLLVELIIWRLADARDLGPASSSQVWSIIWLEMV